MMQKIQNTDTDIKLITQHLNMDKENVYKKKKKFSLDFAAGNRLKALQRRFLVKKEAIKGYFH